MQNSQTAITNNDWQTLPLGDCVDILDNQRVPINSTDRNNRKGDIPYYGATGQVGWINDYLFDEEILLLGEDGAPFLDKSKQIAYIVDGKSWVNNHAHVMRAKQNLTSNWYLKHYLDFVDFSDYVSGTTRLKLNQGMMKKIPVVLPDKSTQLRLVSLFRKSFQNLEISKGQIDRARLLIQKFRQAILFAGVTGKLTEGWRVKNPNHSPLIEAETKHIQLGGSEIEGWKAIQLGKLFTSFGGGTPSRSQPEYWNGDIPWVSSGDVKTDIIEQGSETITQKGLDNSSSKMCPVGSVIVVVRSGILKHTLPVAVVKKEVSINQDIKCFYNKDDRLNKWLLLYLRGKAKTILAMNREGTTVQSVKYSTLQDLIVDIPPFEELKEIMKQVIQLLEIADSVERQINNSSRKVEKLTQSILAKAFHGDLIN